MEAVQRIPIDHSPPTRTGEPRSVRARKFAPTISSDVNTVQRRLFTVEDYHRMGEWEIFGPDERVELIDGEIFLLSPIGPKHASGVNRLNRFFVLFSCARGGAPPRMQKPIMRNSRRALNLATSQSIRIGSGFSITDEICLALSKAK